MKTVKISLNSIDKVKSFVNDITKFDYDFDLVSGRYVIDAKSIMGIFSLDLSKPIDLNIHADDNVEEIMEMLKPYLVTNQYKVNDLLRKGLTCLRVQPSFLLHLFYFNDLNGLNRLFHQLIDLLIQILFRTADHINIRLGYRMFCHKDRTAVFERLDRGLISIDFFLIHPRSPACRIRSVDGIQASYIHRLLLQDSAWSGLPPVRYFPL